MMANLSDSDRRALRFGGMGVGGILFVILVLFPVMDQWEDLQGRKETANKEIRDISQKLTDRVSAASALKELREISTVHGSPSSLNRQTARMLQQVERVPGYRALGVQRLEGLPLREEEGYRRSAVSLQFSGTLADVHQFLKGVESAKPGLKVERLTISTAAKDRTRIEGQMVIAGYAVVLEATAPGTTPTPGFPGGSGT